MSGFRVEKGLSQITGALEALVQSVKRIRVPYKCTVSSPYTCPKNDEIPRVPMCFASGLHIVSSLPWITILDANLANISSTDFPVSKADDRRLLVNTSGVTSVNIWFVTRTRRIRARNISNEKSTLLLETHPIFRGECWWVWQFQTRVFPVQ